ncbi:carboxypeptidase-like regulatory domain-containing protein [Nonlabens ponticola]|uniref:Carboxypeptidase-like regulatory domain-containing protein n=1 Tax=Nonlabens ponticola TaxID=2496866 RepID=A0A3S9MUK4_9FLAO|nr:carboxypeptidase-like regulatory domain-containing protein [Nonlabens ponticola]AZQ42859.1 hypothetical protein EJ995_00885 [Nonlabens ponticola]
MKYLWIILVLFATTAIAQVERTQLQGSILTNTQDPLDGITVFNNNTLEGTVTNELGVFYIDVRAGDKLAFQAVQFKPFVLTISEATVKRGTTELTLNEGVNVLDEVIIEDQSMIVDVVRVEDLDLGIDEVSERNIRIAGIDRVENTFSDRVRQPEDYTIRKEAFMQSQPRFNMFNAVGLLLGVLGSALTNNDAATADIDLSSKRTQFKEVLLKNKYDKDYLVDYLQIKEKHLYEFMVFAQERGLDRDMLESQNELELLKFLDDTATIFKSRDPDIALEKK